MPKKKFVISFSLERRDDNRYDLSVYLLNTEIDDGVDPFGKPNITSIYLKMIRDVWNVLLYHAERGIHFFKQFLEEVKPEDITYFSTLPIVLEKYNDWDDGDKNGYWHGNYYYAFRIPTKKWGAAELKICKEIHTRAGEDFDCRAYRIQNDDIDHPKRVQLYYNFSQSERIEGRYKDFLGTRVYFFDDELYAEALQWYRRAKKIIPKENRNYLAERIDDGIEDFPT